MTNCDVTSVSATIRTYTKAVQSTSLDLLKAVDETVDALIVEQSLFSDFIITAQGLIDALNKCEASREIDPEDKMNDALEAVESALSHKYAEYLNRIDAAKHDGDLAGDHEDTIITEYESTLELIQDVHNATNELRIQIREFDADLSPTTGSFSDPEELISHLKAI